jgi:diguanylate cyclase (GGDEF)-like protein
MKLKNRINLVFFLVLIAVFAITAFSFLAVYTLFSDFEANYHFVVQRLNTNIYALMIVSALTAISGVIIFRGLMGRILNLIEELNKFSRRMSEGSYDSRLSIKGEDELSELSSNLNRMVDSYGEKISVLENTIDKRQEAVRELQILNELTGFVMSEVNSQIILTNFASRTSDLIKSDYCAVLLFEPDSTNTKLFITKDGVQDSSSVRINPEGVFRDLLNNFEPFRFSSPQQQDKEIPDEHITLPEMNLRAKDLLALPLVFSQKLMGVLILANKRGGTFDQDDEDAMMRFTFQAFQTIAMHDEIANLAITDGLTGISNFRHFSETLENAVALAKRYGTQLSLMILDVDHFKNFNDRYGHLFGDEVLKSIALMISLEARKTDLTARYGGEEFAVIMPHTPYEGARTLAERIRTKVEKNLFVLSDKTTVNLTVSIGFASIPMNTQDKTKLIELADKALYTAKEKGRNLSCGISDGTLQKNAQPPDLPHNAPNV